MADKTLFWLVPTCGYTLAWAGLQKGVSGLTIHFSVLCFCARLCALILVIPCKSAAGIAARRVCIRFLSFAREQGIASPSLFAKAVMHNKSMFC